MTYRITPWDVDGEVDYAHLMKEFGTQPIDEKVYQKLEGIAKAKGMDVHVLLRRGFYYSHRDLEQYINDYEQGKPIFIYSGIGPSGPLHIGHALQFEFVAYLQQLFDADVILQLPDDEKFVTKKHDWKIIQDFAKENMDDLVAFGFHPEKTFFCLNHTYIEQMYIIALHIAKKIPYKTAQRVFGFDNTNNIGHIFYPALQIAPTFFLPGRCLIPCGIDQDNYFRLQRDIAPGLKHHKASLIHSKFLYGLQGKEGKMSASDEKSSIFLHDTDKVVQKKINKYAFSGGRDTLEEHRKHGAILEVDVAYQWLMLFFEPCDKKMQGITEEYGSGKMLTSEIKKLINEKLIMYLGEFRKKKEQAKTEKVLKKVTYSGELAQRLRKDILQLSK